MNFTFHWEEGVMGKMFPALGEDGRGCLMGVPEVCDMGGHGGRGHDNRVWDPRLAEGGGALGVAGWAGLASSSRDKF